MSDTFESASGDPQDFAAEQAAVPASVSDPSSNMSVSGDLCEPQGVVAPGPAPLPPVEDGPTHVVGVGASAGGLEALERMFDSMPADAGLAFVVVQHLSPDFKSLMDELLARHTALSIHRVEDGMEVRPNSIYLLPPKKEMIISHGRLLLTDKDPSHGLALPIDVFLRSLAQDFGPRAIGVILSGTGSDGSRGIRDIHEAGGLVIAQSEESAKFDGMPRSAVDTGVVDLILPPEQIPRALVQLVERNRRADETEPSRHDPAPTGVDAVFRLLRKSYGIDFSSYKPSTVARRIERRLMLSHSGDLETYVAQVANDEAELNALYRDLLIGVTSFFRDREAFDRLAREVIPDLVARAKPDEEIRVWVAGCATGEEAYSLAILLDEHLSLSKRRGVARIFATDVHRESLNYASVGCYPAASLSEMSPARLEHYFVRKGDSYQVTSELRKMVVFAPHNLLKDAPFTKLDLITCRNLLIYFQPLAQKKVLSLFHFSLKMGGILFLGPSESPGELTDEFDVIDNHWRMFRKRRDLRLPTDMRLHSAGALDLRPTRPQPTLGDRPTADAPLLRIYDAVLDQFVPPSFLVNARREILHTFAGAGKYLNFRDGRQSSDILDLIGDGLRIPLAGALRKAALTQSPVVYHGATIDDGPNKGIYRVTVRPLPRRESDGEYALVLVEPTQPAKREANGDAATPTTHATGDQATTGQVQSLETELQYAKENLQSAIEELETSNEELQATNEELVASNEELQSTNEELHSVNEELYTVNAEYQRKIAELTELNNDMDHLFQSTDIGTVFLDRNLCIRKFTPRVARIFNLLPQDLGRRIDAFAHRLASTTLIDEIRRVLETGLRIEKDLQDQGGHWYLLRILPYQVKAEIDGVVLTLIDIARLKQTEQQLRRMSKVFMDGADPIIIEDLAGHIVDLNSEAERVYGWRREELVGQPSHVLVPPSHQLNVAELRQRCRLSEHVRNVESVRCTRGGAVQPVLLTFSLLYDDVSGAAVGMATIAKDITEQKRAEAAAREAVQRRDHFLAMLSHELRNPLSAVLTAARVLDRQPLDQETLLRACSVIRNQSAQMGRLLDDLLDVSRVTQGKIEMRREVLDLTALVGGAVEAAKAAIDSRRQQFSVFVVPGPLWVDGDPSRLLQIQGNLLTNASKYTPVGGRIWLDVNREGRQAVVRVRDTGQGITPDMLEPIFDLFVQSNQAPERSDGGMGVGLTLVRQLVEMHGGTVVAHSDGPGRGSEFVVRLPLAQAPLAEPSDATMDTQAIALAETSKLRVAVVEDNNAAREMMTSLLKLDGYQVLSAADGRQGVELILREKPNVAFVDIGLPGMDGYDVARRVREHLSSGAIYLVALTGYGSDQDRRAAISAGFDEHLVKPLNVEDMYRVLRKQAERAGS